MTVIPLLPPQLTINQKFTSRPAASAKTTRALLFGGMAQVIRYTEAAEKPLGSLGNFVPDAPTDTAYDWPNLAAGNVVDLDFVKLMVDNGLFQYFQDSSETAKMHAQRNLIRLPTEILTTDEYGTASFVDGGVKNGDIVFVEGVDDQDDPFELLTYVIGTKGDTVAATVGVPAPASSNAAVQAEADTEAAVAVSQLNIVADASSYDGITSGYPTEVYTLTCLTGGAPGVAVLSVQSASNTDNNASLVTVALDDPLELTDRGGVVVFSVNGAVDEFVAGQTWQVTLSQQVQARTLAITGTYTGTAARKYIVNVTRGGLLASSPQVQVTSQDGSDTLAVQTITDTTFSLGSYGLTGTFTAAGGLVRGDKWVITVTPSKEGIKRTVKLATELPDNVVVDDVGANLHLTFFRKKSVEISELSVTPSVFNYTKEASQITVNNSVVMNFDDLKLSGVLINASLKSFADYTDYSKLYVTYRAWYPASSGVVEIGSKTELSNAISGPIDSDNPLGKGVEVTRLTCGGESVFVFAVGDPSVEQNWIDAFDKASQSQSVYSYVPLTNDAAILAAAASAANAASDPASSRYRVLFASSGRHDGAAILDATTTDDEELALAVCEDNVLASGTQYTQVRLTSGNADFQELGVRVGDYVRFGYEIDAWGVETYEQRVITEVRSATVVAVNSALFLEAVPRRVEIHRIFNAAELAENYGDISSGYGNDIVRCVLAPEIVVGGEVLPSFYAAAMVAGLRSNLLPQAPLSTQIVSGVSAVRGLELLSANDLNILAARGSMIVALDQLTQTVRVRHGVTTGDRDILAHREESMVTARHIALMQIADRLRAYAGRINISDDTAATNTLVVQIQSEMSSLRSVMQGQGRTPELGGLIVDLIILSIAPSAFQLDELDIEGELVLGRPGNSIKFNCNVRN